MPDFTFTGPNGEKITVAGPEGATLEDAQAKFNEVKANRALSGQVMKQALPP